MQRYDVYIRDLIEVVPYKDERLRKSGASVKYAQCEDPPMSETDKLALMARWLHMAAREAGKVELVRSLIQHAMRISIEMYGLPGENEPDDPEDMTTIVGCFAAAFDECEREDQADG